MCEWFGQTVAHGSSNRAAECVYPAASQWFVLGANAGLWNGVCVCVGSGQFQGATNMHMDSLLSCDYPVRGPDLHSLQISQALHKVPLSSLPGGCSELLVTRSSLGAQGGETFPPFQ